jgi:hypothetical protein
MLTVYSFVVERTGATDKTDSHGENALKNSAKQFGLLFL